MSPGAANLYVYYRVRSADAAQLIAAVDSLQARLRPEFPGLVCSLSRRLDDAAQDATLMETYSHAEGLSPSSQQLIEQRMGPALRAWIVGDRHVERFIPCA